MYSVAARHFSRSVPARITESSILITVAVQVPFCFDLVPCWLARKLRRTAPQRRWRQGLGPSRSPITLLRFRRAPTRGGPDSKALATCADPM